MQEMTSGKAKLKKQKTLEKLRLLVDGAEKDDDTQDDQSDGLEEVIGMILQSIQPILRHGSTLSGESAERYVVVAYTLVLWRFCYVGAWYLLTNLDRLWFLFFF